MNTTIENNKFGFLTNYGKKISEKNFNKFFDRPTIRIFTKLTTQNVKLFWYCDWIFFLLQFFVVVVYVWQKNIILLRILVLRLSFFVTFFCSQ